MDGFILSPVGVFVLMVYSAVIISIALFLGWLISKFLWKWMRLLLIPPVLILLGLPLAEETLISKNFTEACKDAGVKVYRQVEVEGYFNKTRRSSSTFYPEGGFRFVEYLDMNPRNHWDMNVKIRHVERINGDFETKLLDSPTARYHLVNHYQPTPYRIEEPIGWKIQKMERRIIDSHTGEILGRDTAIKRVLPKYEVFTGTRIKLCHKPLTKQPVAQFPSLPFPEAILKPVSQ